MCVLMMVLWHAKVFAHMVQRTLNLRKKCNKEKDKKKTLSKTYNNFSHTTFIGRNCTVAYCNSMRDRVNALFSVKL